MQINGVGSGQVKDAYQRTTYVPNSATDKKEDEEAKKRLEAMGVRVDLSSRGNATASYSPQTAATPKAETSRQESDSILDILKILWEEAKKLIKQIWESPAEEETIKVKEVHSEVAPETFEAVREKISQEDTVQEDTAQNILKEQPAENLQSVTVASDPDAEQIAQASVAVTLRQEENENLQTAVQAEIKQESFWQKLKVRFKELLGQLMGNMPESSGGFQADNAMDMNRENGKQETPKEPAGMPEFELDGAALHFSQLQDSYDRNGRYKKLADESIPSMSIRK